MAEPNKVPTTEWLLPPMRGEKVVYPVPVRIKDLPFEGVDAGDGAGYADILSSKVIQSYKRKTGQKPITGLDFDQSRVTRIADKAAGLTDYIYVRLKHRGLGKGEDAVYKFLVNPETIQVSRQVVDAEAMTRAGMQTGIWGDTLDITISGVTAGQYFAGVLIDGYSDYSASNRNLQELVAVYENNGSWFEGETGAAPAAMAPDATRKQIQMHADVQLVFGNFIWFGCFTNLSVDDTADTPYYNKFNLSFMAWKERFKSSSPWRNSIAPDASEEYRGHAYELYQKRAKKPEKASPTSNDLTAAKAAPVLSDFKLNTSGFGDVYQPPSVLNGFNPGALSLPSSLKGSK